MQDREFHYPFIILKGTDLKEKANLLIDTFLGKSNVHTTSNNLTTILIAEALESEEGNSLIIPITIKDVMLSQN